jgi:hypothetical protein
MLHSFLEGGTKYSWEKIRRQRIEQRQKERPFRDGSTWGYITYTVTKPKYYCGCQEVLADRSLIWLSPEKGFAAPRSKKQCQQTRHPGASGKWTTN